MLKISAMSMKKVLLPLLFISLVHTFSFSQVLYSSIAYTSRFNPGVGSSGTPIIAYDDVCLSSAQQSSGSISITKIKVGIRRAPNAPATNVNLYYTTFHNDTAGNNTTINASHVFLGKVNLPVNGASLVTSVISLGDSVATLFKIKAEKNICGCTHQKFLIGASFDNPSSANGIVLTKAAPDNADSIWIDNTDSNNGLYATSFNGHLPASYYLEVFGNTNNMKTKEEKDTAPDVAINKNRFQNK